jgi:hypothetical protein
VEIAADRVEIAADRVEIVEVAVETAVDRVEIVAATSSRALADSLLSNCERFSGRFRWSVFYYHELIGKKWLSGFWVALKNVANAL